MSLGIKLIFYGEHEAERGSDISTTKVQRDINSFSSDINDIDEIFLAGIKVKELRKKYKLSKNDFLIQTIKNR